MSISRWVIAASLGLSLWASQSWGQATSEDQPGQEESTTDSGDNGENQSDQTVDLSPALEGIEAAIRDLIAEEDKIAAEAQQSRENRDLKAQEGMARWAELMFYATAATVALTLAALFAIIRTLHHTRRAADAAYLVARDTRDIGEAQVRAYLHCGSAAFEIEQQEFVTAILTITNTGQSPASDVSVVGTCTFESVGGLPHMPSVHESVHSVSSDMQGDPVPSQGEGTYRVLFDAAHFARSVGADYTGFDGKEGVKDILTSANVVAFNLKFSWADVFGVRHDGSIALNAGINNGPYYPNIKRMRTSGGLEIYVED